MEPYLPTSAVRQPPNEPPANGAASSSPSCVKRLTLELVESYLKTNPSSKPIQTWRAAATTPRENGAKPKAPRRALTQPCEGVTNDGADNAEAELVTYAGDVLGPGGEGPAFEVLDKLGRGSFGQVFRCRSRKTGRLVAIKVVKNCRSYAAQAYVESQMARALHARDPHPNARRGVLVLIFPEPASPRHRAGVASMASRATNNTQVVHLFGDFAHRGHVCLVFELLGMNLYELLKQNQFRGLPLASVRLASTQVVAALDRLAAARIVHCDLKPENILVAQRVDNEPTRVKIIDLGSACVEGRTAQQYVQSRFYRAPEVLVAAPYDGAVDVWSAACVFAELFLGLPLFPGVSTHDQISRIADMLGPHPDELLARGDDTLKYFTPKRPGPPPSPGPPPRRPQWTNASLDESVESLHALDFDDDGTDACEEESEPFYSLKSAEQYAREKGNSAPPKTKKYFQYKVLKDIVAHYPVRSGLSPSDTEKERRTRATFAHFVTGMLDQLPHRRWTPLQASKHPFLSGGDEVEGWAPCRDPRADERRLLQRRRPPQRPGPALRTNAMDSSAPGYRSGARVLPSNAMDRTEPGRRPNRMDASDSSASSGGPPFRTPPPLSSGGIGGMVGPQQTYAPGYWPGQLPPSSDFAPLRRNATMTQAQMAHAQWEASRAAPVQVSSYTAGYRPHQAATAESYDFGHALQRPAVQQQHPGYAAPYQLRRSVSLDPSRTPPPPRLNPGSPAFAPRSPPAVGGRARARHHPNSPGMHQRQAYYPVAPQYGGYYAAAPPPQLLAPPPPPPLGSSPPLNTRSYSDNGHNGHNGHRNRRGGRRGNNNRSN